MQRTADTTGVFFRHTDRAIQNVVTGNPGNAEKVRGMIRRHYEGGFPAGKAAKPFVKLAQRVEETVTGLLLGGPGAIGRKIAQSL